MMSSSNWPWDELGLDDPPETVRDVKRAYARRLKQVRPEEDAEGFQRLRDAYEYALQITQQPDRNVRPPRQVTPPPAPAADIPPAARETQTEETPPPDPAPVEPDFGPGPRMGPLPVELEPVAEPLPSPVDWSHLDDLIGQAGALLDLERGAYDIPAWLEILNDPVMISVDASQEFERFLFNELLNRTEYYEADEPVLPDEFSLDFAELLEARFHWYSDGVGLGQRFGFGAEWILDVLASAGLKIERRVEAFKVSEVGAKPPWLFRWQTPLLVYGVYRLIEAL